MNVEADGEVGDPAPRLVPPERGRLGREAQSERRRPGEKADAHACGFQPSRRASAAPESSLFAMKPRADVRSSRGP